jgi:transcriptional regulator with XRE-family HTH domain
LAKDSSVFLKIHLSISAGISKTGAEACLAAESDMNVGERIRKLRSDRNLTQPELAQAIGIEQSYLSKLENDRSVPSAEIFDAVLVALDVDVGTFLENVDEDVVSTQLRHIPQVAVHLSTRKAKRMRRTLAWLVSSAAVAALGVTMLASGYFGWGWPNVRYDYQSQGLVRPGEPTNIFAIFNVLLMQKQNAGEITAEQRHKLAVEYWRRIEQREWVMDDYRGESFVVPVAGGVRSYSLQRTVETQPFANRMLMMAGMLLGACGFIAMLLERRFFAALSARFQANDALRLPHDNEESSKRKQRVPV